MSIKSFLPQSNTKGTLRTQSVLIVLILPQIYSSFATMF